jgi:hypothetical protein
MSEEMSMKWRKKPVVIEATQWFKNGDHPFDYASERQRFENGVMRTWTGVMRTWTGDEAKSLGLEGQIVRYYRHPKGDRQEKCKHCNRIMHDHGWIDTLEGGHIVCPGDWVITGVKGEHYPCKPDIFALTYEPESAQESLKQQNERLRTALENLRKSVSFGNDGRIEIDDEEMFTKAILEETK